MYLFVMNKALRLIDALGLTDAEPFWKGKMGGCDVEAYHNTYLDGQGGETGLGSWEKGPRTPVLCGGGTNANDPGRYYPAFNNCTCKIRIDIDPRSDPNYSFPGWDKLTLLEHEKKHAQCAADAYAWMKKQLDELKVFCCCELSEFNDLIGTIEAQAALKRIACSGQVDAVDYGKITGDDKWSREARAEGLLEADTAKKAIEEMKKNKQIAVQQAEKLKNCLKGRISGGDSK